MLRCTAQKLELLLMVHEWLEIKWDIIGGRLDAGFSPHKPGFFRSFCCCCCWLCSIQFSLPCHLWSTLSVSVYLFCSFWNPLETVFKLCNSVSDHTFLIWMTALLPPTVYFVFRFLCLKSVLMFLKNSILFSLILQLHFFLFLTLRFTSI
jgi:hypothetical protein